MSEKVKVESSKTESKSKRKLFGASGSGTDDDLSPGPPRKIHSSSRRHSQTSDRSSPLSPHSPSPGPSLAVRPAHSAPQHPTTGTTSDLSAISSLQQAACTTTPSRLSVPLSERQQLALLKQMTSEQSPVAADNSSLPASPHTPSSSSSGCHSTSHLSAGKRTPQERRANKRNERGETPLHLAAIKGDGLQAKKLIIAGADVNVKDFAGWTPLHEACNHGWLDVAELLLNAGANVNVQGLDNDTPLHDASVNGHEKLVELLVRHGANALQSNSRGKTPLDVAASSTITKLLKKERIDLSNIGEHGLTSHSSRSPESSCKSSSSEHELSKDKIPDVHPLKSSEGHRNDAEDSTGRHSLDNKDKHRSSTTERGSTVPRGFSPLVSSTSESDSMASSSSTSRRHISPKAEVSCGGVSTTGLSTGTPITMPISVSVTSSTTESLMTQTKSSISSTDKKSLFAVYAFEDDPSEDEGLRSLHNDRDVPCYTSPRITDKDKLSPKMGNKSPKADRSSPKLTDSKDSRDTGKRLNVSFADKEPKSPKSSQSVANQDRSFQTIENPSKEALKSAVSTRIDRSSPKPDRSSPKPGVFAAVKDSSVSQGKAGSPKVPPLKIIIPTKSTASSNSTNTRPDTETNKNNGSRQALPYIVNSSQGSSGSTNVKDIVQNASGGSSTGAVTTTTMASVQSKMSVGVEPMEIDAVEPVTSSTVTQNASTTTSSLISSSLPANSQLSGASCTSALTATVTSTAVTGDSGGARQSKEHDMGKTNEMDNEESNIGNDAGSSGSGGISSSSSTSTTSGTDAKGIKVEPVGDDGKFADGSATAKGSELTREKRVTRSAARTAQQKQKQTKGDDRDMLLEDKDDEASNSSVSSTSQQSSFASTTVPTTMPTTTALITVTATTVSTSKVNVSVASTSSSSGRDEETHIPPRKRKPRQHKDLQINSNKHVGTGETITVKVESDIVNYGASSSSTNPTQQYLNIRGQVDKRRKTQEMVVPKAPQGYSLFRSVTKEYMLESNASTYASAISSSSPKPNLQHPALQELYKEQEKERQNLRAQHLVQQEKLQLSVEQEVMREHGRAARAMSNHEIPLSFTTVLIDAEVYSPLVDEDEKEKNVRCRYNARTLLQWLQDVRDKYEKIKESTLRRHQHERDSLYATQCMHWEWKLREIGQCEPRSTPVIDAVSVPRIFVDDDFDLLPSH